MLRLNDVDVGRFFCHFRVPIADVNATRKMARGELLVLGEPPWWLVPRTKLLKLPGAKAPYVYKNGIGA